MLTGFGHNVVAALELQTDLTDLADLIDRMFELVRRQ